MPAIPNLRRTGRTGPARATGEGDGSSEGVLHRAVSVLLWVAVIGTVVFFWPTWLGGSTRMTMVGGRSMEPTYQLGDLLVVREAGGHEIGDIVVFEVPEGNGAGSLVVHRIVERDADGFWVTQGDNRNTPDRWPLTDDDIVGRPVARVPHAGNVIFALRHPWAIAGLVGLAFMILFWPRRRDDERADVDAAAVEHVPAAPDDVVGAVATIGAARVDDTVPILTERATPTVRVTVAATPRISPQLMADAEAWLDAQLRDAADAWVDEQLSRAATDATEPLPRPSAELLSV